MFKRTFRRVVNAAALAALLAMASPVSASAQVAWTGWTGAETLLEGVWSWLTGLGEISGTVERGELSGVREKAGEVIGPDGGGLDGDGGSGDPTCTMYEAGICIDPNG